MLKNRKWVKSILIILVILPLIITSALFIPGVQKYIIKNQLSPWLSNVDVNYIHITPFSVQIDSLSFKYEAIDISIKHLESEFSPFKLFSQRIKIDKLVANQVQINNTSIAQEEEQASKLASKEEQAATLLFPGLFPYLDIGFIFDIGLLDIEANYHSQSTGPVDIKLSASDINETTDNPLRLQLDAKELSPGADIQGVSLAGSIRLEQHLNRAIDAQNSDFIVTLRDEQGSEQIVSLQLAMKQLSLPTRWASFPFDKFGTHYLTEILHPESITLNIEHSSNDQLLSKVQFDGQYDGNEGIISGNTKLLTNKDFVQSLKNIKLPKLESQLQAQLSYNTRQLQGAIDLTDNVKIDNYTSFVTADSFTTKTSGESSLPKQIELSNHLKASINKNRVTIHQLLVNIFHQSKHYIKILTHKPLSVTLNNIDAFLEQENSELMDIHINQIPLLWLNDFLPEHTINSGIVDASIQLSIENSTLKLSSNRPLNLKQLTLTENHKSLASNIPETPATISETLNNKNANKPPLNSKILLSDQDLEADFKVTINKAHLNANISQLKLSQSNKAQAEAALNLHLIKPFDVGAINNPLTLETHGFLDIQALISTPLIHHELKKLLTNSSSSLKQSLPQQLALNFNMSLAGESRVWTINKSHIDLSQGAAKKPAKEAIFQLNNHQAIQLKQEPEQIKLITAGPLFSAQITQFNFNWLAPFIQQFASPYDFSGYLKQLDLTINAEKNNSYKIDINQLLLSQLKSSMIDKSKKRNRKKLLFKNLNLQSKVTARLSDNTLSISYPLLTIKQKKTTLLKNNGSIIVSHPGDQKKQSIAVKGKLYAVISRLMNLKLVTQLTSHKVTKTSLLNANYKLAINPRNLIINKSELKIRHPESKGLLSIASIKPITLAIKNNNYNFSQNGQLEVKLDNFDISPYETFFPDIPISFADINGHFELQQKSKKQKIRLKTPIVIRNIHYKKAKEALLQPFDLSLDFSAQQHKNITKGELKQLSIKFINDRKKANAFDLQAKFELNQDKEIPVSMLAGNMTIALTQWLDQPVAIPDNTLSQGTLNSKFSINKKHQIEHQWLINNLVDKQGKKIVESLAIDGKGQIYSLADFSLSLPIIMKSMSGQSKLMLNTRTSLQKNKKISMSIDGQDVFLNDILKLLTTINPQSGNAQPEAKHKEQEKPESNKKEVADLAINKTPDEKAFWQSGFDVSAKLGIDKLYYSDYMSFREIMGDLNITDQRLQANNFHIKFHDSPMDLNALFEFNQNKIKPYDITLNTSLSQFNIGDFLKDLNPEHKPRADGVFDVNIGFYGDLSNLSQIRNELLFDINIQGKEGVFHLIPSNDVMMRSSGAAMAVVGEVVSVLPTSGFGLGIVNRVIRFAKDINYDAIYMHLVREKDRNTTIKEFQILSPELRIVATGGLTFKKDTRLFDQALKMTANMNLAGEGAAIFYGLGLLKKEQDEYGFWKGPVINFSGSLNHQQDNFKDIIDQAKKGTLAGGITNPFSGLIGNFKYRWFDKKPDYQHVIKQESEAHKKTSSPPIPN